VGRKTKYEFSSFGSGAAGESVLLEYDTAFPISRDNLLKVEMSKKNSTCKDDATTVSFQCRSCAVMRTSYPKRTEFSG